MKTMVLSQGLSTIVDDDVFEWANKFKWYATKGHRTFYACRDVSVGGKRHNVRLHNMILERSESQLVDHINLNGLDNRRENLRLASNVQNHRNGNIRRNKKYGSVCKGVQFRPDRNKWRARIFVEGKEIFLGSFETQLEAAEAYNRAAKELDPTFFTLNKF